MASGIAALVIGPRAIVGEPDCYAGSYRIELRPSAVTKPSGVLARVRRAVLRAALNFRGSATMVTKSGSSTIDATGVFGRSLEPESTPPKVPMRHWPIGCKY
jgi:hypothetical protein